MSKFDEAQVLFQSGANCAQSVLAVFADECGLDRETALRLASGFGAGMGRMREVCGAVSAMLMVVNLKCGYSDLTDKAAKDAHYALIQNLADQFRSRSGGSIICRDLLGLQKNQSDSPLSESRTAEYYRKRPCKEIVAIAADILEKFLTVHGTEKTLMAESKVNGVRAKSLTRNKK